MTFTVHPVKQGSQEWLALRRTLITSTDAPVIMGASPYCTLSELYKRKKGLIPEQTINTFMQRGIDLESEARSWFERKTGIDMFPQVVLHNELPFMASLDGLSFDETSMVEIKVPSTKVHAQCQSGSMPDHYKWQCMHHLMVTGLPYIYYMTYDGREGSILKLDRDESMISALQQKSLDFYKLISENNPPPLEESDFMEVEVDEAQKKLILEWTSIYHQLRMLEKEEKKFRDLIINLGDDGNIHFCENGKIIASMQRIQREGTIDWKKLASDRWIDEDEINEYRKSEIGYYKLIPGKK